MPTPSCPKSFANANQGGDEAFSASASKTLVQITKRKSIFLLTIDAFSRTGIGGFWHPARTVNAVPGKKDNPELTPRADNA
jgi:hypothetical protein